MCNNAAFERRCIHPAFSLAGTFLNWEHTLHPPSHPPSGKKQQQKKTVAHTAACDSGTFLRPRLLDIMSVQASRLQNKTKKELKKKKNPFFVCASILTSNNKKNLRRHNHHHPPLLDVPLDHQHTCYQASRSDGSQSGRKGTRLGGGGSLRRTGSFPQAP